MDLAWMLRRVKEVELGLGGVRVLGMVVWVSVDVGETGVAVGIVEMAVDIFGVNMYEKEFEWNA